VELTNRLANTLDDLARACRILEMEGHGDMTLGHLSLRDPEGRGFWMKRNAFGLGEIIGPDDFVLVDMDGNKIAGQGGRHSEWPIHSEILRNRPDINVVGHTHPQYASVFSASTESLLPYTVDADYFTNVPRHEADVALITTKQEGQDLANALGDDFVVLLASHGVTFVGTSVSHATCVAIFFEKACKAHVIGNGAKIRPSFPNSHVRQKRHSQIMTPVHWEHSWAYFTRKLAALSAANTAGVQIYR
jgi:L-fuculose-phosphate aldolase